VRSISLNHNRKLNYLYPAIIIYNLLFTLREIIHYGKKDAEFELKFIKPLVESIENRCKDNNDFSELDEIGLNYFFKIVEIYFNEANKNINNLKEHIDRYICEYYMKSNDPTTQIKGLHKLKEKLGITSFCILHLHLVQSELKHPKQLESIMKTINEFHVLEVIFIKNPNAELIEESIDFIRIEIMANRLTSEIVPLVWNCYISNL